VNNRNNFFSSPDKYINEKIQENDKELVTRCLALYYPENGILKNFIKVQKNLFFKQNIYKNIKGMYIERNDFEKVFNPTSEKFSTQENNCG
jgi:hypothetical protein